MWFLAHFFFTKLLYRHSAFGSLMMGLWLSLLVRTGDGDLAAIRPVVSATQKDCSLRVIGLVQRPAA
jgi:hypothetical protein